jgi:hypothetical protein
MAISVLVSTTGAGTFTFPDLGGKSLTHPIVDEEFIGQFTASELAESVDFQAVLTAGDITVKLDGTLVTDTRLIAEGIQDASGVPFNNATSGLTATDLQAAMDEVEGRVDTLEGSSAPVDSVFGRTGVVVAATSDYDANQVDYANGTSGMTATDVQAAIDEVEGRVDTLENSGIASDTFCVSGGRNANNATDVYLRVAGNIPTNETPFVIPYNCTLINLTGATNGAETWTGEVRIAGTLVSGAALAITAATTGSATVDIDFNAGDAIQLFCNGTSVSDPMLNLFFQRR